MNHAPFAIKETLLFGFRAFKHNLWLLLGVSCISITINLIPVLLINIVDKKPLSENILQSFFQKDDPTDQITQSSPTKTGSQILFMLLIAIVKGIANLLLLMGWNQIALDIYDTGTSSFKRLLEPRKKAATFFLAIIMYGLICFGGTLLLIIPGIIWGIKYSFADLIVIDSKATSIEALKASGRLTYGYKWDILLFYFIAFLINVASMITLIGPFILTYVLFLSRVYIYRALQKQWDGQHQPPTPFMP